MFRKILIANRGEIACRIARTARRLGIATAAVYSDADRHALHVSAADEAVHIGPAPARESYLNFDAILDAARRVNADAIHPGYGFLAENADFAEACAAAGVTFIGPRPESIRQMGSKAAGRAIAEACGVPVVPGYNGPDLEAGAAATGYPLILKASAGGGGRGMRIVRTAAELGPAIAAASREAKAAFGDDTLLIERYVEFTHHIEVQIFGDSQGRVIHLFERDCSLQRRHQKIIEESPSPAINDATRAKLYEAAVAIGQSMSYTNAGTVEFLVSPNGDFYFIEVNTRIQVEHPVTECVTGLDLIELQIRIAEGCPLEDFPLTDEPMGHAIEARLCAESPAHNFAPSIGTLTQWRCAADRVDSGVAAGSTVSRHYDSLLAKVITHGATRDDARLRLRRALKETVALGVDTNVDYLIQLLETPEFVEGRAHTAYLPDPAPPSAEGLDESARALALFIWDSAMANRRSLPRVGAFRNNPFREPTVTLSFHGEPRRTPVHGAILNRTAYSITAEIDGIARTYAIAHDGRGQYRVQSPLGVFTFHREERHPRPKTSSSANAASSPMPGQVLRVLVKPGQSVSTGTPLVVVEAMKMEQTIASQREGVVTAILVKSGDVVSPGQTLVQIGEEQEEKKA